jgi:hypothetical protein
MASWRASKRSAVFVLNGAAPVEQGGELDVRDRSDSRQPLVTVPSGVNVLIRVAGLQL